MILYHGFRLPLVAFTRGYYYDKPYGLFLSCPFRAFFVGGSFYPGRCPGLYYNGLSGRL